MFCTISLSAGSLITLVVKVKHCNLVFYGLTEHRSNFLVLAHYADYCGTFLMLERKNRRNCRVTTSSDNKVYSICPFFFYILINWKTMVETVHRLSNLWLLNTCSLISHLAWSTTTATTTTTPPPPVCRCGDPIVGQCQSNTLPCQTNGTCTMVKSNAFCCNCANSYDGQLCQIG